MLTVKQLVSELSPLPTLPDVALRAQDMLCDPDVGLMEVAKVIELDPVLSARIVHMANSPIYGGPGAQEYSLGTRASSEARASMPGSVDRSAGSGTHEPPCSATSRFAVASQASALRELM